MGCDAEADVDGGADADADAPTDVDVADGGVGGVIEQFMVDADGGQ